MPFLDRRPACLLLFILALCAALGPLPSNALRGAEETEAGAQPKEDPPEPQTIGNPSVPLDHLEVLLRPLTVEELEVEAEAWLELLKAKVREISLADLAARREKTSIAKTEAVADAAADARKAVAAAEAAREKAVASGDEEALEAADEALAVARKRLAEANEAAEDARTSDAEAASDAETQAAKEEALRRAEEKAREDAGENGDDAGSDSATASAGEVGSADAAAAGPPVAGPEAPPAPEADASVPEIDVEADQDSATLERKAAQATEAARQKTETRAVILESLNELRDERTALIDRFVVVLDALEEKGGDEALITKYRKYIAAVSNFAKEVDVSDVSDLSDLWIPIRGWLTSDEGGKRWLWNLVEFAFVLLAFFALARFLGRLTEKACGRSRRMSYLLKEFVTTTVRRVTFLTGLVIAVSALEVNVGPVLALIGAAGFVIGFALQGTLSNFASGIMILVYRPFDVGHVIEVAGVSGTIESTNLVSTHVRTFDNKLIIVPNNKIWGDVITNATGTPKRRVDMVFGIGYGDDIGKAQAVLEAIIAEHPLVLKDPEPVIKMHELGESSVNFICRPWARTPDYWTVYWDVTRAVKERFDREGISIPFPQRDIHVYHETPAPQPVEE